MPSTLRSDVHYRDRAPAAHQNCRWLPYSSVEHRLERHRTQGLSMFTSMGLRARAHFTSTRQPAPPEAGARWTKRLNCSNTASGILVRHQTERNLGRLASDAITVLPPTPV